MNRSKVPSLLLLPITLSLFVLAGPAANAQVHPTNPVPVTDINLVKSAVQAAITKSQPQQQQLIRTALEKGWPLVIPSKKGHNLYLHGIDRFGKPSYIASVDNIISAATIGTSQLYPGAKLGLTLNGSAANLKGKIAIWDEGLVRPTHVELTGRVIQVDNYPTLSDHSTHVSGTMIAAGVNPAAKGMAYGEQLLQCYNFDNDVVKMGAAAPQGLLASNHSYATVAGWNPDASNPNQWDWFGNPGDTVDISFGLYDQETQQWDSIAYANPLYLICKAGGNNRGDTGPPAGTDYYRYNAQGSLYNAGARPAFGTAASISSNAGYMTLPTYSNAKNIATVGAVLPIPGGYSKPSDVVLASFSSLGPTGDGRIKPDFVADGVNVLSSISTADDAYDIYSGTSMATPAITGSSMLLQQYYSQLHNTFMRSATLKGLLIHTADEAGNNPGPDYVFGWGLVDISKAAAVITSDNTDQVQQIHESSLTQGTKDSESWSITASGKMPVSATICWTDPPAVPANIPSNERNFKDNTLKLINDLDLRIKDNTTGTVYMPWTLNPLNSGAAAIKSDNFRDNEEKVELTDSLIPGRSYTITITHKNSLQGGTQNYSLMISGAGGTAACTSASTASGASIDGITLSNLTNTPPPNTCRTYTDYTALTPANLAVGQSVPFSIPNSSCNATNNTRIISVYIDFNNDGTFETNELAAQSAAGPGGTFTGNITVPATVVVGSYARMRVIAEETNNPAAIAPCGIYGAGETQDYRVTFTNPSTDVGVSDLEYPSLTTCPNDSTLVAVRIHNYGTVIQKSVPVTTVVRQNGNIIATYSTTCRDSIPADSDVVFSYSAALQLTPGASYTFTSFTSLSGDLNPSNDSSVTTVTANSAGASVTGSATVCGNNATSVQLKANSTGDDVVLWYDSQNATAPIAAGSNTNTTDIKQTYYVALNDLTSKGGPPNALTLAPASASPGFYYPFDGQFVEFTTSVPMTIQSARLYTAYGGTVVFTLASLASFTSQGYSYYPIDSVMINVYASNPNPQQGRVAVNAGQMTDTGGIYYLNLPIPNPGSYILIAECYNGANLFLNSNITSNPYPISIPGVFSITGNSNKYNPNVPSDTTFDQGYYFPLYDIGVTLDECPGPRTAVNATTEAAPQITNAGNVFTSTADSGNQWYLNDTAITGATGVTYTAQLPGTYYTVVTDPVTGCQLKSNKIPYTYNGSPVTVSPNPSNGSFQLQFLFNSADNTAVEIYDMIGQRVYEQQLGNYSGYFSGQIDAVHLASGIYVLKVVHGGSTYENKILIKH
jgi:subtilase family protein/GEVED domain-containing protein/type IX secretion system substrate protein